MAQGEMMMNRTSGRAPWDDDDDLILKDDDNLNNNTIRSIKDDDIWEVRTKMMQIDSGRILPEKPVERSSFLDTITGLFKPKPKTEKHPGVTCDNCKKALGDEARFKCLDCPDFDLCSSCEAKESTCQSHFEGKHVFAKIRDSSAAGGNDALNDYKKH